jgi:hypothetical protein
VFNIFGHKGNENQNNAEIPSHPSERLSSIAQTITNAGENVGVKKHF